MRVYRWSPFLDQYHFINQAFQAYWKLEPSLSDDKKDLAAATLRSIALNYIERKTPNPPKALLRSVNQLKIRDDIVITKPDKGSGVVIINKSDYIRYTQTVELKIKFLRTRN